MLKRVNLMVSKKKYKKYKMFGTELEFKRGEWQAPCSGDNGGPLMYQDSVSDRWVIIGSNWSSNTNIARIANAVPSPFFQKSEKFPKI